jgi:hypothetical protein
MQPVSAIFTLLKTSRALFRLHEPILEQTLKDTSAESEKAKAQTEKVMATAVRMVMDVTEVVMQHQDCGVASPVTPSYVYLVRAALRHVQGAMEGSWNPWLREAERQLMAALTSLGTGSQVERAMIN